MNILVILASFNGLKYIEEQINSILTQENVNVTLFIFDDGSNDGTFELLLSKFSFNSNQIKITKNDNSSGSAANNFLHAIRTIDENIINAYDYVAFSDQDDIWLAEKLYEAGKKMISENSNLYTSNLILWDQKKMTKSIIKKSYSQKKYDHLFEGGSAGCTYVMDKKLIHLLKDIINKVDYINWKYFSHDWFIYFVARIKKLNVFIDDRAFILYRIHDSNQHGHLNSLSFYAIKERLKLIINGWYYIQAKEFINLLPLQSKEAKIYKLYTKNYLSRIYVLFRYNFTLIRSPLKAIQFFIISLIPFNLKK